MMSRPEVELMNRMVGKEIKVLDHGFIRVVDYMGDDAAIVQAARVSYGKGTKTFNEDAGLINYLMRHKHCYDDQTEVLTEYGFMSWRDVKLEDKLGCWDQEANSLVYESPKSLVEEDYSGDMYGVEHGGVDLLVTPEHKMWVSLLDGWDAENKEQYYTDYKLLSAKELNHRSMVKYSKVAPYNTPEDWVGDGMPEHSDIKALLRLIGLFVGDGSAVSTNTIQFRFKKVRKIVYLKDLLYLLGWSYREVIDSEEVCNINITKGNIGTDWRRLFYNEEGKKRLPYFLLNNSTDSLALLEGLKNSDGHVRPGRLDWSYSSYSPQLLDQVHVLGVHAGLSCSKVKYNRISFHTRKIHPRINQGKWDTRWTSYTGKVYCAETRTGILVVRRNGIVVLSGNSTPFEMCEIKLHVKLPIFVARQWIRHRTGSFNEYSARYSVLDNEFYVPVERI